MSPAEVTALIAEARNLLNRQSDVRPYTMIRRLVAALEITLHDNQCEASDTGSAGVFGPCLCDVRNGLVHTHPDESRWAGCPACASSPHAVT